MKLIIFDLSMKKNMADLNCVICSRVMHRDVCGWTYHCDACDYWAASLKPDLESESDYIFNESKEGGVISFLDKIRLNNYNAIFDNVKRIGNSGPLSILDVGCASGLFIKTAKQRGHIVLGVEPNPVMAKSARDKGFDVIGGYFPDAIPRERKFDIIIFNDVFEHIPNLKLTLNGCSEFLTPGGMLVISLPNSSGFFFRLARILASVGMTAPWKRLWQVMFYTPHLHYFNPHSLRHFLDRFGFSCCLGPVYLESFSIEGLWSRLSIDKSSGFIKRFFLFFAILIFYPFIKYSESDAFFMVFNKPYK